MKSLIFTAGLLVGVWIEGYLRRKAELSDENLGALIELWELEEFESCEEEEED